MNISLKQLQVFRAVASERNFSRAGERIGLTQPAVSRAITELETQVNLRLIDRTTRDVKLTQAGQILAQRLPRWMDELENTLNELHSWANNRVGKVRIASSPTLSAALMPHCLALCARQAPGLQVILLDRIQHNTLGSILNGEVDFGVIVEPDETHMRELYCETLLYDPFVVVYPGTSLPHLRQHAPRSHTHVPWKTLSGENLILLDHASGSRRLIDNLLNDLQIAHRIVQEVGHVTTGFEMVRAGLGINIVPGLAIPETGLQGLVVVRPTPVKHRRIMLARQRNKTLAPLANTLWDLVIASTNQTLERRGALLNQPGSCPTAG
ncbi:MAG: LysR family transcriptional regulator [Pusillimonas sp.]|nr:LysR family transcriptional regulator [Pusillimonas sp.]MBC43008.1 LysR family transcriptional regulator [Pusillimonas sp.]HCN71292.1 LysR family transcriptional regulator [Pusillimonas sp.]|tara:strand:+ start:28774 stop:29745 length:972 start_codon:yes stop_codon:yes gene_type:complete